MKINTSIAERIISLKNADLTLRNKLMLTGELFDGYNQEMESLHIHNADVLDDIMDSIGYPSIDKVGKEANEAAWLIIQHAISKPSFMKKCALLLTKSVLQKESNPIQLAYLQDRIAVFEGKVQLHGTQFDWGENGMMNPNPIDDILKVNERRKALGLNTLEEQTIIMRNRAAQENESSPADLKERKAKYNLWRKKVGWAEED